MPGPFIINLPLSHSGIFSLKFPSMGTDISSVHDLTQTSLSTIEGISCFKIYFFNFTPRYKKINDFTDLLKKSANLISFEVIIYTHSALQSLEKY